MKVFSFPRLPASLAKLMAVSLAIASAGISSAQTITKADNTSVLDTGTSWSGGTAPGAGNVADWSGTYNTAGSLSAAFTTSTPVSWQGIRVGGLSGTAAGLVSIGGTGAAVAGSSVTIGTSGIDMSGANQNLVINAATTVLGGNQAWNIATGRNLRFGNTGTGGASANVDGSGTITLSGGGVVDANQGGVTGFSDAAGFAGFSGKWVVNSGATLRGLRNGATAWGTNTAADAITLSGGTLAVGGIAGTQGDWTWNTPITLTTATTSSLDQQIFSGTGRRLKLMGALTGDATTNLIFKETGATNSFDNDDRGYIIAVDNPNLAGTVTLWGAGATENNISGRLSSLRVGGVGTAGSTNFDSGTAGTLGTATVVNNGVLTLSRSDTWTFANAMSGTGSLRIGGAVIGAGTQVVTVSGNNSFSGGTTVGASGSTLKLGHANALGSGTLTIGTTTILDNVSGGAMTIANALSMSGGSPTFTGTNDMTIGGPVSISGITAGQTRTITVSANTLTLSNAITEGVAQLGLTKAGPGTLTLSSVNSSFTGQVALSGGTTNVAKLANTGSNSSLGAGNAAYTIRLNGGTMNYNGAGGDTTDRTIQLQASGAINNNGAGTIAFTAPDLYHSGTASARTLTLGGNYTGGVNSFASSIGDSGTGANITSLTKNGSGTWALSGTSNYSGPTSVNTGTLLINGTHTGVGLITVSSGAILGGTGTMVDVTVAGGGTLAPGQSGGFITMKTLNISPTSILAFELDDPVNPAASDRISVQDFFNDVGGVLNVSGLPSLGTPGPGASWLVVDYTTAPVPSTNNGSTLTLGSNTTGLNLALDVTQAGKVLLVVVPEPASAGFLLLGILFLRSLRRRP